MSLLSLPPAEALTARVAARLATRPMPWPAWDDRAAWRRIADKPGMADAVAAIGAQGVTALATPWPQLTATEYMQFARTGDRIGYETPYFARRTMLGRFAAAELIESRGRYRDALLDAAWSICEETTWCVPAHNMHNHAGGLNDDPLPRTGDHAVDLFAADTAAIIGIVARLLATPLGQTSTHAVSRLRSEVERRVIVPVETTEFQWFDGFNNWTPWIVGNVLIAAAGVLDDPARVARLVQRLLPPLNRFIDRYGEDGGCDEGPSYFAVAAGALFDACEIIRHLAGDAFDPYMQPKFRAMGRYIATVHLAGPWFAAFSDASPEPHLQPGMLAAYGRRTQQPVLEQLAADQFQRYGGGLQEKGFRVAVQNTLRLLVDFDPNVKLPPAPAPEPAWLPDLQVLVARTAGAPLALAAKAGHNAESHNHNDVGHFIVFAHGHPWLIDAGRETYTRQTFSARRYELWFTRGNAHHAPIVNGHEQTQGREHHARDVTCTIAGSQATLAMELAAIYPAAAGVESLHRTITWAPAQITVADQLTCRTPGLTMTLPLLWAAEPTIAGTTARATVGGRPVELRVGDGLTLAVEKIPLTDPYTRAAWGECLWRVMARCQSSAATARWELTLSA